MRLKFTLYLLVFFILPSKTFSSNDINFSKIAVEHGLSQLSVMCIYQDELGAMWFGTREGANRYNGNGIEIFKPIANDTNSLGESLIHNICGDKNGLVFFHTSKGVNVYNLRNGRMHSILKTAVNAISYGISNLWITENNILYSYINNKKNKYIGLNQSKSPIVKILQTSDQRIFLGTLSSGVFVVDQHKQTTQIIPSCSEISDIFEDSKHNIWIATWLNGLFEITKSGQIINYRNDAKNLSSSISSDFVRAICEDNNGYIWIGTKKGLDRLDLASKVFKHYGTEEFNARQLSNESVWSLIKDSQGTIWAGTYFGGVNYFNPQINFFVSHDLQKGSFTNKPFPIISDIVEDKQQNLYLCTEGNGLIYYNTQNKKYNTFNAIEGNPNSLSNDNIKSCYYDAQQQELWLGTHLGGFCKLDLKTSRFTQYKNLLPDNENSKIVRTILPYQGNLLIATYNGLFLFNKKANQITPFSDKLHKSLRYFVDVKIDKSSNIWIASLDGLYYLNNKTGNIQHFKHKSDDSTSLANDNLNKLLIDHKNRLWVATCGDGVDYYNVKSNTFKHFNSHNSALKNNFVSKLFETKQGSILITTTQGFSILDVEKNNLRNFGIDNGLPLNSLFNGGLTQTSQGEIFLAGMNGLVSFKEENLTIPHRPFILNLVNLSINGQNIVPNDPSGILETSLAYTKSLTLSHDQASFAIEFASNNYIPTNQPIYRYRLLGLSDKWTVLPQGTSKLNFINVSSGKYSLEVEAISATDGHSITATSLNIRVNPPFYSAWYAYLFYLVLLGYGLKKYLDFKQSKVVLESSLLFEKKEKAQLEAMNQSKLSFFTNISHEFRTPLTLIAGQVDMLLQMQNIQPRIYNKILSVKRNTLNMQSLINELLEFRKSEQGHLQIRVQEHDLVKFLNEIYLSFLEFANYQKIKFNFDCKDAELLLWFDPNQLQKVFYNLISNALKFTPKEGIITINLSQKEESVLIDIIDNGVGIAPDAIEKIFDQYYQAENGLELNSQIPGTGIGLALTKNILEMHGASIELSSQQQLGSRFTVILRKGSSHFSEAQKVDVETIETTYQQQLAEIDDTFIKEAVESQVNSKVQEYSMLIVEDNPELRSMLETIFQPLYTIYTAVDGVEGLELTIEKQPDIVLSDLMMPRMSGLEMCSKIKHNFAVSHIPVVLLTAQTAVESNIEGLKLGADDYITKPFNIKTLITRCNNLVNGRKILQERFSKHADFSTRQIATNNIDKEFLEKAQKIIEENFTNSEFDVSFFSREMALGRTNLFNKIKGISGQTPNDFINTIKLQKAASLLNNNPELNITDITYMLGFSSPKYFTKCFKDQFGVSPSKFRKGDDLEEVQDAED